MAYQCQGYQPLVLCFPFFGAVCILDALAIARLSDEILCRVNVHLLVAVADGSILVLSFRLRAESTLAIGLSGCIEWVSVVLVGSPRA